MRCMSCQRPITSKEATLWQTRVLVCPSCSALADKAKAVMDQAHARAAALSLQLLEQQILRGGLLAVPEGEPNE